MTAPHPEPVEFRVDELADWEISAAGCATRIAEEKPTPQHQAWITRKRREREGLPLRRCDREQVSEQLSDM
jgi:hypothetical protein